MPTRILPVCCAAARAYGEQVQAHMASRFRRMTGKGRGWDGERREERGERGRGEFRGEWDLRRVLYCHETSQQCLSVQFVGEDMQRQIC